MFIVQVILLYLGFPATIIPEAHQKKKCPTPLSLPLSLEISLCCYWKASRNTSTTLTTTRNIMMRKTTTRCVSGSMLQRRSVWRRPGRGLTLLTQLRAMRTPTIYRKPQSSDPRLFSSFLLFQPRCQENPNLTGRISSILLFMFYSTGLSLSLSLSLSVTHTRWDDGSSSPWLYFLL